MSKLDPSGESLESILASIRRSLAEQATDVLAEDAAPQPVTLDTLGAVVPGEDDVPPPRFLGNGGNGGTGAPRQAEVPLPSEAPPQTDRAFAGLDDPPPPASIGAAFSRLDMAPPPTPAAGAPAPQPEEAPKDPLWFLTRGGKDKQESIPAPAASVPLPPATAQPAPAQPAPASIAQPPPAAPTPALKEIVRGPLPPFFGSNPEAANVEVAPTPPMPGSMPVPMPGAAIVPPPPAAAVLPAETEPPRSAMLDAAPRAPAGSAGPAGLGAPSVPTAREAAPSGRAANAVPVQPAVDSASPPPHGPAQLQGLDAMVADLLRPMLRRWLDENMPRLVSAALKAEVDNLSKRDPKKP